MNHHLEFHPDLSECVLEDRALMAVIVPSLPWLALTSGLNTGGTGPGSSSLSVQNLPPLSGPPATSIGGNGSLYGPAAGTSITSSGAIFSYYGLGYGTGKAGPTGGAAIGSGANDGSSGGGRAGTATGYGSSVNSGYGTSLNALNGFGVGQSMPAAVGGMSFSASEAPPNPNRPPNQVETESPSNAMQGRGNVNQGAPMIGVDVRGVDTLLKGGASKNPSMGVTGR